MEMEEATAENDTFAPPTTADASTAATTKLKLIFLIINAVLVGVGNCGGPLITRLYFLHGGSRLWFSSWLFTAGWPIILIPLLFSYLRRRQHPTPAAADSTKPTSLILIEPQIFLYSAVLGVLTGFDGYLYAYGASKLPVSTSLIVVSTQMVFIAVFAFFIVKQKFSSYSVNAVALLTLGALVLGLHTNGDRPEGESSRAYALGLVMTVAAAALYGLMLPLIELMYRKARQEITYTTVMEIQLVISFFATAFCTVGMIANKDFHAISREAREFELGKTKYYLAVTWSAIIWQCGLLGSIGVIFYASSLVSGIMLTSLIPFTELLAVIFFHEKFKSEKGVALFLSLWGFTSYYYGEFKSYKEQKKMKTAPDNHVPYDDDEVV